MADTIRFYVKAAGRYNLVVEYLDLACNADVSPYNKKVPKDKEVHFDVCRSGADSQKGNGEFSVGIDQDPLKLKRLYKYDTPYNDQHIQIVDADVK
jgi:hypothetical protein